MRILEDLYDRLWLHPAPACRRNLSTLLERLRLPQLLAPWDPRRDPTYGWRLSGVLEGRRLCLSRCSSGEHQLLAPRYEAEVCNAMRGLLCPGWTCADVGAHIGYMTLLMAKLVGAGGHVYAFEAAPENAQLLQQNVRLNGYERRVTVENCAVADGLEPETTLFAGPSTFEATIMARGWQALCRVPAIALDRYFASGQRLDFIKMDIEGGEVRALPGMKRLLREAGPIVLLEIHDIGGPAVAHLEAAGYVLYDMAFHPVNGDGVRRLRHCLAAPPDATLRSCASLRSTRTTE